MAADLFMLPAALLLCTRARSRTPLQLRTPSTTTGGAE
jgi:hypothetical protein